MKKISIIFLVVFFSLSALAGGQIGSGGNGCTLKSGEWKSIEELLYPHIFENGDSRFIGIDFELMKEGSLKRIKLSDYIDTSDAFRKLRALSFDFPKTYQALVSLTELFEFSYLIQGSVKGVYNGDRSFLFKHECSSFTPALMTLNKGGIIFFRDTWGQLSAKTSEIILIHEVLRLAQMFHPAFKSLEDWRLQKLTSLLFTDFPQRETLSLHLKQIEESLKKKYPMKFDISKYQRLEHRLEIERLIKNQLL